MFVESDEGVGMIITLCLRLFILAVPYATCSTCLKEETRRLSIYAYTGNIFFNKAINRTCSSDANGCQNIFDGVTTAENSVWRPDGVPSFAADNINKKLVFGRFLCFSDSCSCYENNLATLIINNSSEQSVYLTRDPFDLRGQGWFRFDLSLTEVATINLTLPMVADCKPQFWEVELYSLGTFSYNRSILEGYCAFAETMSDTSLTISFNGAIILFRLSVVFECVYASLPNVTLIITMLTREEFKKTFTVESKSAPRYFFYHVDRLSTNEIKSIVIVKSPQMKVTCDVFYLKDSGDDVVHELKPDVRKVEGDQEVKITKITDGDIDTGWSGQIGDQIRFTFNGTIEKVKQIDILQKNVAKLSYQLGNLTCKQVEIRKDVPDGESHYAIIQPPTSINVSTFNFTIDDVHGNFSIMEVKIFGTYYQITTTSTTTTSTTTTTTSTTTSTTTTSTTHLLVTSITTTRSATEDEELQMTTTFVTTATVETDTELPSTGAVFTSASTTATGILSNTTSENGFPEVSIPVMTTLSTTQSIPSPVTVQSKTVTIKILGVQYDVRMKDTSSEIYKNTSAKYVPVVEKALTNALGDRFLSPVYNVQFSPGSIYMTFTFNVSGSEPVAVSTLQSSIIDAFNQSQIEIDPSSLTITPTTPVTTEQKWLVVALASSLTSLVVVIATVLTIISVRRHVANRRRNEDVDSAEKDSVLYSIHNAHSTHRMWQTWYNQVRQSPEQNSRGVLYELYSNPNQSVHQSNAFDDATNRDELDYFTDAAVTGSRGSSASNFDKNDLDPDSSWPGGKDLLEDRSYTVGRLSSQQLANSPNPDSASSDSHEPNDTSPDQRSFVRSLSDDVIRLPKYYRHQDFYRGFFDEEDGRQDTDRPSQVGLRRTDRRTDILHPLRNNIWTQDYSVDNNSEHPEAKSQMDDSGYDDALKLYYRDPKLDDRNILEKLSDTFGRKADMLHRRQPPYLKRHKNNGKKSKRESRV